MSNAVMKIWGSLPCLAVFMKLLVNAVDVPVVSNNGKYHPGVQIFEKKVLLIVRELAEEEYPIVNIFTPLFLTPVATSTSSGVYLKLAL